MNFLSQFLWFKKLKLYIDWLWLIFSMIAVPGLIGITAYWYTGAGNGAIVRSTPTQVRASPGDVTKIKTDLEITTNSTRTIYRLQLVDTAGNSVCVYPDMEAGNAETPEFGNILIRVPDTVSNGSYKLFVDIVYLINPIKTNVLRVKIADITVDKVN